ncbi:MAG: methylmalonyl-CoA mutase family protein [Thermodesulfobacteriota bacterium]|nr:methylmalonyl-CoA mutase family protein [Thermodesulfobacteriota bacterium]
MVELSEIAQMYFEKVTDFTTPSGIPIKRFYTPEDLEGIDYNRDLADPGEYPFTRGHHPDMYRGKLWNIREISGLATPKAFNKRLKFLLEQGQGALDWEMDGPTMYGLEPDQPMAEGQIGVCGISLHTLDDVDELCKGLPLDQISLCMASGPLVQQAYMLVAKSRGLDLDQLRVVGGHLHYYAPACMTSTSEGLFLPNGKLSQLARLSDDWLEYVLKNYPKWNAWFISAYDFREAGGNAIHEIAFTKACAREMIREMLKRGIDINTIGRKLSPVLACDRDFFEEIAKLRAARRIWARMMKEEFNATDPRAMKLRFHIDVSGVNYTRQQPLVNIARGTLGALAAVLGGCMGIQLPSYDEGWATPTEDAVRLAIRTQQVIRYESGVARVADPLAGSYFIERLTNELEEKIEAMAEKIEQMGGWVASLKNGWALSELKNSLLDIQSKVETGERVVLGVNRFPIPPEEDFKPEVYSPDRSDVESYIEEFKEFKKNRDIDDVKRTLDKLRHAAEHTQDNLSPFVFDAIETKATFEEITGVLRMIDGLDYDWAGERKYPF